MTYASTHGIAPSSKEQASYLEPALIANAMIGIRKGEKMKAETQVRMAQKAQRLMDIGFEIKMAFRTFFLVGLVTLGGTAWIIWVALSW